MSMELVILEHHLQKDIVRRLISVPEASFSALKPKAIESNLFMYHLRKVIKLGLVEKCEAGYRLTRLGKQFVDRVNLERLEFRIQPKLITVLAIEREDAKWLVLRRKHQPFFGV